MKKRIVRFHQQSCHACHTLEEELGKLDLSRYELVVYHTETCDPSMGSLFDIRNVPTVILLDNEGEEIDRFVGHQTSEEIQQWLTSWGE